MSATISRADAARLRAWRWRILFSTWVAYAGYYFCRKAFYVVKASMGDALGFDAMALAHLGEAYLIAYTLGQFVSAGLGSRVGARLLLLGGMALSIGSNVAFAFGHGYATFLGFMLVNGLAQGSGWPGTIGTLASWTTRRERGTVVGIWSTCYQLGGVAANAWAAFWLARAGWRGAFGAASLVLMGVWVIVFLWQRNRPEDVGLEPLAELEEGAQASEGAGGERPIDRRALRQLVITTALVGVFYFFTKFVRYALWSWTPYLLERHYHLSGEDAGYLSTVFDIAGFLGVIVAGVVSDRLFRGRRATVALVMLVGMIGGALALYVFGSAGLVPFSASLALVGFMLYGPDSLLSGAGAIDIGSRRAALAVAGVINGMGSLGSVVQETAMARAIENGHGDLHGVFSLLVGAAMAATAAIAVVMWRNRLGHSDL